MLRNRSVWNAIRLTGAVLVAGALALAQSPADRDHIISNLQTIGVEDGATPVTVYRKQGNLEAPNWTRDGASLLFNEAGSIKTISIHGGEPQTLDTGNATHCNGSHGLSPDGKLLGITCTTPDLPGDRIFVIPTTGGTPRVVTQNPNSYWHGWSPDGRTIAFARPDHGFTRIHTIQMDGQNETAVTPAGSSVTIRTSHRTAGSSTSTPIVPASCRSGACIRMGLVRNRSPTMTCQIGRRTPPPTANCSAFSAMNAASPAMPQTKMWSYG